MVPIIDLSNYTEEDTEKLAEDIIRAMSDVGFLCLINHGIPPEALERLNTSADTLFALPTDVKKTYARLPDGTGYVGVEVERWNPERPADYKEAYDILPNIHKIWPMESPDFEHSAKEFFSLCAKLTDKVLTWIAIGLKLEPDFFVSRHDFNYMTNSKVNHTLLRILNYPAVPNVEGRPKDQLRCGEHTDFGTLTLLFQDAKGGLEVCNRAGEYCAATPIPGGVYVNIGDLLMRWTADKLVSTKHRVLCPASNQPSEARRSVVFFVHPDDDCWCECTDGSQKYAPITSGEYLQQRFSHTY